MLAKIYRPSKTAMQSGQAATRRWILEFEPRSAMTPDPLMGWSSSADTTRQVKLTFDTREQAIDYARRHGIPHQVMEPKERKPVLKAYGDNFSAKRKEPWSH
ncbi:MAG: ETC complex I subunit [Alphaproteobacteria bacterium]|nr:ETC complex I subunit [Alphaproteobacteria bacterium]